MRTRLEPALGQLAWTLLLVCLAQCAWAQREGEGLEVRASAQALQAAVPGDIVSLSFRVTNATGQEEVLLESLQLPADWQAITPVASFHLGPQEEAMRLVAFQVPRGSAAGPYEVSYGVHSQRDSSLKATATLTLAILPVTKLALLVEEKPDAVIAGTPYQVRLRLLNQSNLPLLVKLEVTSEEKYPAQLAPTELSLAAAETAPLELTIETDAQERRPRTQYLHIKAQGQGGDGNLVTADLTLGVEIIPRVTGEVDDYHRLPVELTLRLNGEGQEGGLQAELKGKGALDEADSRRVDFRLRGPDTQSKGLFGLHDEYWFEYSNQGFALRAGDQSCALSRLTSSSSYGQGLSVEFHPASTPLKLGAFYLDQGQTSFKGQEGGLYWTRQLNPQATVQLNCLRQERGAWDASPASESLLWSAETRFKLPQEMQLELEYARCQRQSEGSTSDSAYRLEWEGRLGQGGYWRAAKFHAGPDYYGAFHDSDFAYATLSYPLSERLQGSLAYNRYQRNLELRPESRTADREALLQAGARYSLDSRWYLLLNYDSFQRRDELAPSEFDFKEQALRIGLGASSLRWSLRAETRLGDAEDRRSGESETVQSYNFFAAYRPRPELVLSLYAGFGSGQALKGSRLLGGEGSIGASASWQLGQSLELQGWYTKYGFDSDYGSEGEQYDLRLKAQLPSGHKLALEVRRNNQPLWGSDTCYQLAYIIPLDLPVSRKGSVGSLKGRLYDAEAAGRPGVEGAILRISGATAVTDEQGRFTFPSLVPGSYQLFVDRASLGLEWATEQPLPLTVVAVAGKTTQLELGLVPAARLMGSVLVMPAPAEARGKGGERAVVGEPGQRKGSPAPTGLVNTLVELGRDQECLRCVTDAQGQFLFEGLRPGPWHLKVYDNGLPAYHYLENPEQDLTLEPGQNLELAVRILPKTRQIRFIDAGTIQVGASP